MIKPLELANMSSADLASDELKKKKNLIADANLNAIRTDWNKLHGIISSSEFKCRKCKSEKTAVSQAQTRSADEPMTTFVTCLECGSA